MQKDIIYIDTEDDITSIIGKIKDAKEKVIALVPPRRVGVLQSAVNLRLLYRAAQSHKKHLVIITNNKALIALSAAAKIPVAKNLQSKPELVEIDALEVDDGEDIIDGSSLPVGDLAKTVPAVNEEEKVVKIMHNINIDQDSSEDDTENTDVKPAKNRNKVKVPNFNTFRKKLFLGIFAGIAFVVFMVWAIFFAPAATVVITARTEPAPVSMSLKLVGSDATDITQNTIQSLTKTVEKDLTVDFTATGKEEVGKKATGTMTLSNLESTSSIHITAGSAFSSGGYVFVSDSAIDVPGYTQAIGEDPVAHPVEVNVTAEDIGAAYNLPAREYVSSVLGITANGGDMTGGESHEATVVTADDIKKAKEQLLDLSNDDKLQELKDQFANGEIIIEDSFEANYGNVVSSPALGKEASSGKAVLTTKTKFSLMAVAKSEIETYLKDAVEKQITDSDKQKIYDNGIDDIAISNYDKSDDETTINIATTGKIGPNIDQTDIKQQVKGQRYGDIQSLLEGINGVVDVDVKFSYFWVSTVPNDVKKISIEFVLEDGESN